MIGRIVKAQEKAKVCQIARVDIKSNSYPDHLGACDVKL